LKNKEKLYEIAEEIKRKEKSPAFFGKFFIYKSVNKRTVKHFNELTENEKINGIENKESWIFYNRGNKEGYKWFVPYNKCINWSKEYVKELKDGIKTNSRYQGVNYFNNSGFAWIDYFTTKLKSFYIEEGVYSKNIVKFHSMIELSDLFFVGLLNSTFITYYIKNFITKTHTLQINDGRLIPIVIPDKKTHDKIVSLVKNIIELKTQSIDTDTLEIEEKIDNLFYKLYNIEPKEFKITEQIIA